MSEPAVGVRGLRYAEGVAPFGALDIVFPKRNSEVSFLPSVLEHAAISVIAEAWSKSEWLAELVPADMLEEELFVAEGGEKSHS
jgi:hypothetical protein